MVERPSELGGFLKSRRASVRPQDVGITPHPSRRRVAGLRREELAMLAGVSITHYTRLEQGRATGVSDSVLEALARTLRLTEDETAHLKDLARPRTRSAPRTAPAPDSVRQLLDAMTDVPALLLDRCGEVLAWNPLGHALLGSHLPYEVPGGPGGTGSSGGTGGIGGTGGVNLLRMLFLDERYRALYVDRAEEARLAVASLRIEAGRHPEDRGPAELVGQLALRSDEFAALWARHPVRTCTSGVKELLHPAVGRLTLSFENLVLPGPPGAPGRRMITYTAAPGSPSDAALRLLAGVARSSCAPVTLPTDHSQVRR
ncbi:helix-turn-helix transcriptional regulator [Streptomyces sp. NPDC090106]|uniref:helix-turn-helix transcriptional regulator n=1 Tax=Streptomyces sp. NPDC090106 TaxID=3365946 RepID=UPI003817786E